ncbi:delta-60 repeat domain-containing protein [Salinactinospora qingdaonensis]|uniref:Delta-60 repeat domain-containing protein n=1 Tax=Salinactinospora qingdaonensis TaxID=702744 RepID=A0ABP7G1M9_9ACTN
MPRSRPFLIAALSALAVAAPHPLTSPAIAATAHAGVVSEQPAGWTPHVLDGSVKAVARVGDTVVVGGRFSAVTDPQGEVTYQRDNIFAFTHGSGEILAGFRPELDGAVLSIVPGPKESVYVGGRFTQVDDAAQHGLAHLRVNGGTRVAGFAAEVAGTAVHRLATHGDALYVGGQFSEINGRPRSGVARLDGRDGSVDPGFDIAIGQPRSGPLRVQELALSPDGDQLVINGTFTTVEGRSRPQIAMIDTSGRRARLSDWSTRAYAAPCDYAPMHTYMRQMDFAPDGSYFAVVTTGGPADKEGLCKSVARWENENRPGAEPTWVNHTGGDSLYAVAVTGAAVYVGGHQRWLDNPEGHKEAGPGAVERRGIGAVDPRSGRALAWNPGRPRGYGVEALTVTDGGLYVGSDTERLAGEYHARLGMFPV